MLYLSAPYSRSTQYFGRCTISQSPPTVLLSQPTGIRPADSHRGGSERAAPQPIAPVDLTHLDGVVQFYVENCIASSTRASYASAQRRFLTFCQAGGIREPYPVDEELLGRFVAFLGQQNLKHCTIKCYLSGIRFSQIHLGLGDPFQNKAMPRLEYILTGIKQVQARAGTPPKPRLPITPALLEGLRGVWLKPSAPPDHIMLWAAACTGFFGFLRAGEFTVPTAQGYDPEVHLSLTDVAIDSHTTPSVVHLRIKQSKTDPLRQGVDISWGPRV